MSNYPPGVTGNEPEIAGYPPCGRAGCGHLDEDHAEPVLGIERQPTPCLLCECPDYTEFGEDFD